MAFHREARLASRARVIRRWPLARHPPQASHKATAAHHKYPRASPDKCCAVRPCPSPLTSALGRRRFCAGQSAAYVHMHTRRHIRASACHTTLSSPRTACSDAGTSALRAPARTHADDLGARPPACGLAQALRTLAGPADSLRGPAGVDGGRRRCAARRYLAAARGSAWSRNASGRRRAGRSPAGGARTAPRAGISKWVCRSASKYVST